MEIEENVLEQESQRNRAMYIQITVQVSNK